jgi:hypothetical protein
VAWRLIESFRGEAEFGRDRGMADVDECTLLLLPQRRKAPTPQAVLNELATLVPSW